MSDKSERAYWWIDARANELSKWIDSNLGRLLLIAVFAWLGTWGLLLEGREDLDTFRRLIRGMGPELAGIVIAAVTIDTLAERRQEQERKAQLIRQLGSRYRDVTEMAIIELRHKGWLEDGSLAGAILAVTDLSEADLRKADMSRAYIAGANLSKANLMEAKLSNAYLAEADLKGADLRRADLGGSKLMQADLSEAYLAGADLRGTTLWEANVSKAYLMEVTLRQADLGKLRAWTIKQLEEAKTLEGAIMPDGAQLRQEGTENRERIEGLTFGEWKAQYLATHGGGESDIRNPQ